MKEQPIPFQEGMIAGEKVLRSEGEGKGGDHGT